MEQALAPFEQYLNRRFGQSSTPKHYVSDLKIFIRIIGDKAPQDVTPADVDTFIDDQFVRFLRRLCRVFPHTSSALTGL